MKRTIKPRKCLKELMDKLSAPKSSNPSFYSRISGRKKNCLFQVSEVLSKEDLFSMKVIFAPTNPPTVELPLCPFPKI